MSTLTAPSYPALVRFAIPVTLAAVTVPLMGMVDTAVLGRLGDPAVIAAAGIGGAIFTVLYWCFSFLRFTTTGLVAQAMGRQDHHEVLLAGLRPMLAAVLGGLAIWLLQWPIAWVGMRLLAPPAEVAPMALQYFHARIWSAPFTLLGYAQFAWLLGQGHARAVMLLQLVMNMLNAALAMLFVLVLHWGIAGAGWATVTAEASICAVTTALMLRQKGYAAWRAAAQAVLGGTAWRRLIMANFDIMVRSLLLTCSFALVTERSAHLGTLELAANQILMQAFLLYAYLLEGFATAAEVFGAHAYGAGEPAVLSLTVRRSLVLSLAWSAVISVGLALAAQLYVAAITPNLALQHEALRYWPWVAVLPLVCVWAFLWDGVFMGATRTRTLRNTMLLCVGIYVPTLFVLSAQFGNHGIWAAFTVLMALRSLFLTLAWPGLKLRAAQPVLMH